MTKFPSVCELLSTPRACRCIEYSEGQQNHKPSKDSFAEAKDLSFKASYTMVICDGQTPELVIFQAE